MPYYEYRCEANGRTVEVRHAMSERLDTWGEVADAAGIEVGATARRAPVERLMSAPVPIASSGEANDFPGCGPSCACAPSN